MTSDITLVITINSYWQNSKLFLLTICQLLLKSLNSGSVWQNLILEALTFSNFVWTWLTGIMVIGNSDNWVEKMSFTVQQYTLPSGFTVGGLDIHFVGFYSHFAVPQYYRNTCPKSLSDWGMTLSYLLFSFKRKLTYAQQRSRRKKIFFSNDNYITNKKSLLLHSENYSWSTYDSETFGKSSWYS